ncbi:dihydrodipicolinate reductase [Mycobacterium sp. MUNTM1]
MPVDVVIGHTGAVGNAVVRMLVQSSTFRIVGALAHADEKVGRDVGEIAGIGPIGVAATRDLDELVALEADCLTWHGLVWNPREIARFLEAGTNVYSGYGGWYPLGNPDDQILEAACEAGTTTYVAGGNIPGLISDVLPLFVSGFSTNVRQLRARQSNYVAGYPSSQQLTLGLGIGVSPDTAATETAAADSQMTWAVEQSAAMVAAGLAVKLTKFELTSKEYANTPDDLVLKPSGLTVQAGTPAGVRWKWTAFHGDQAFFEVTNEQTVRLGLAYGWRQRLDEPNWTVDLRGEPDAQCTFSLPGLRDGVIAPVSVLNAARAVNFLPLVVAAKPGIKTVLDLPAPSGRLTSTTDHHDGKAE